MSPLNKRIPGSSNRNQSGSQIDPSIVASVARGERGTLQRFVDAAQYIITGVTPNVWMSPMQPMRPLVDEREQGAIGRQFDFRVGNNMSVTPRAEEGTSFSELRALADAYDLMRLVIETRKDQIEKFEWEIVPKAGVGDRKSECAAAAKFFERPSLEFDWTEWLRAMMEDLLVIDAVVIYPRMTLGGKLASLDLVDGATIKRLIDEGGRTPLPPSPAYQQILKGIPAANYSSDELLYFRRNVRTNRLYGYSPVEQVIMTVNIALRRQVHQLQFYTEGNVPEALIGVDPTWSTEQITEFQQYFDDMLAGNTAARRRMTFVPGEASNVKYTKEATLKDPMDEWLARITCFAFSIPATPFVAQVNRSVAESSDAAAKEEGLMPLLSWVKRRIDFLLSGVLMLDGIEFKWKLNDGLAPEVQSRIDSDAVRIGAKTLDELRARKGEPPLPNGLGSKPLVYTGSGVMLLEEALKVKEPQDESRPADSKAKDVENEGGARNSNDDAAQKLAIEEMSKITLAAIEAHAAAADSATSRIAKADSDAEDVEKIAAKQRDEAAQRVFDAHKSNIDALSKIAVEVVAAQQRTADSLADIAKRDIPPPRGEG